MAEELSPFRQCLEAISQGDRETLRQIVLASPELHGEGLEHLVLEAAKTGSVELLETLLGLDLGAEGHFDWAMVNAAERGHLELVRWFLDHGVSVNRISHGLLESPALAGAIESQHLEMVKLLIGLRGIASEYARQQAEGEVAAYLDSMHLKSDLELRRELGLLGGTSAARLQGEAAYLSAVVANLDDDELKRKYAAWLDGQQDLRGEFLRKLVHAKQTMKHRDLPRIGTIPDDWADMVGYSLIHAMIRHNYPEPNRFILQLARPALSISRLTTTDDEVALGVSKMGGLPDLPPNVAWPTFADCTHSYSGMDDLTPEQLRQPCGFIGQFQCSDIATTLAGKAFPEQGLLSLFFAFDQENGRDGVRMLYHPDVSALVRKNPPGELADPNEIKPVEAIALHETLSLPSRDGPWGEDLNLTAEQNDYDSDQYYSHLEFYGDLLGYFQPTTGEDVTPDKETQHFGSFRLNDWLKIHLQISQRDLAARNFDGVKVVWIDYC